MLKPPSGALAVSCARRNRILGTYPHNPQKCIILRASLYALSNTPTGRGFIAIGAGRRTDYALKADRSIVAWGWNFNNEASNAPNGTGFKQVTGSDGNGFALNFIGEIIVCGAAFGGAISDRPLTSGFSMVVGSAYTGYALSGTNDPNVVPEPSSSLICLLLSWPFWRRTGWKGRVGRSDMTHSFPSILVKIR